MPNPTCLIETCDRETPSPEDPLCRVHANEPYDSDDVRESDDVPTLTRYECVFTYASPHTNAAYSLDPEGHGWDRLRAIAGEYERGEISWTTAKQWCDENAEDLRHIAYMQQLAQVDAWIMEHDCGYGPEECAECERLWAARANVHDVWGM